MNNIKNLRPKRDSHYKQGYIDTDKCKKLLESAKGKPIIFRSSWEKQFVGWCERSDKVQSWASEPICIDYSMPDGSKHHYYPDFAVVFTNGDKWIVEIKPYAETQKPYYENDYAMKTYIKNRCKWAAAQQACEANGWRFVILTEHTIKRLIV